MFLIFAILVLWTVLHKMIMCRRRWISVLGITLSLILFGGLCMNLGYQIGDHSHSCEPPPIEVYL